MRPSLAKIIKYKPTHNRTQPYCILYVPLNPENKQSPPSPPPHTMFIIQY